jgi:hypothetical protein
MDKGLMKMQLNARSCARSGQSRIIVKEQLWCSWRCNIRVKTDYFIAPFISVIWFRCLLVFPRTMTVFIAHSRAHWSWTLKAKR